MFACVLVCVYLYWCVCVCVYLYWCVCVYMCACMCLSLRVRVCVCACESTCICVCLCVCLYFMIVWKGRNDEERISMRGFYCFASHTLQLILRTLIGPPNILGSLIKGKGSDREDAYISFVRTNPAKTKASIVSCLSVTRS